MQNVGLLLGEDAASFYKELKQVAKDASVASFHSYSHNLLCFAVASAAQVSGSYSDGEQAERWHRELLVHAHRLRQMELANSI